MELHDSTVTRATAGGAAVPSARGGSPQGAGTARGVERVRVVGRVRVAGRVIRRVLRTRGDILTVISAGGALGSLGRWGVGEVLPGGPGVFPWPTFVVNVTGGLLIGVLMVVALEVWPPSRYLRPFLGTGVLGGYTTYSATMLDTRNLIVDGPVSLAGIYLGLTLLAGLMAVWLGVVGSRTLILLARRARARRTGRGAGRTDPDLHRRTS